MTLAFVVRLVEAAVSQGRLAGRVTEVDSGVTKVFRSSEELLEFLEGAGSGGARITDGTDGDTSSAVSIRTDGSDGAGQGRA